MFGYDDYDERESRLASPSEAIAEFGRNAGMDNPDQAWLLHDWDVWVKNPFYSGPPVPHPESDWEGPYDDAEEGVEAPGFDSPSRNDEYFKSSGAAEMDDDIPF
jgi:hypothetical protein